MTSPAMPSLFERFRAGLAGGDLASRLHDGLIGRDAMVDGPFGKKPMLYADYVASGRALVQIERFVLEEILPYYANSHTEASYCGEFVTHLRREARAIIAACCGADSAHAVIFTGSGATAGINRLVNLFGVHAAVASGELPAVIIGPYEHHSNILPWRESGAEVIEIQEAATGGPDSEALAATLSALRGRGLIVGAFSAASNVTGILTDVTAITRQLKAAGAKVIWDYAGGGPYLPIRMTPASDAPIDAVVTSPHKFVGGPGASGVMILRRDAVESDAPTWPGGGTVRFVSPDWHDYSPNIEAREEAGTPNVAGDLRAALAFIVKDALGQGWIESRNQDLRALALNAWGRDPRIDILGNTACPRLPIFSFRLKSGNGGHVHQQLVTRMLSDLYGIQARGGCACAGPYVHRILGIGRQQSNALRQAILSGDEVEKPGFVRLNFSYLCTAFEANRIISSVLDLALIADQVGAYYSCDPRTAIFRPIADRPTMKASGPNRVQKPGQALSAQSDAAGEAAVPTKA
ncbi:MAG: aminotransferase class V-fold PLP-dependent enzyme [Devosia sp.]